MDTEHAEQAIEADEVASAEVALNEGTPIDATEPDEEDDTPSIDVWFDRLESDEVQDVVFILSQVDPLDSRLNKKQRDIVLDARKVWQASGL